MGIKNNIFVLAPVLAALGMLAAVWESGCATYSAPDYPGPTDAAVSRASLPDGSYTPGGYTWQSLVNLAIASSPDYAARMTKARVEYLRYKSKTDLADPRFSFGYSFISDEGRRDQFGLGINFSIPNPFVNRQIIRTGEAAQREAENDAEMLKNKFTSMVYELVQEILIGERELSILLLREQVLSDWENYLQTRYKARMATQTDMSEFEIRRLRLKTTIQQSRLKIQAARRSLQSLVQIPDEQLSEGQLLLNPSLSDWDTVLAELKDDQAIIENAYSSSPELAGAIAAYEKAGASLNAAMAKLIPWFSSVYLTYSPSFTESWGYNYAGIWSSSQKSLYKWTFGVNINLPVFSWFGAEKKMAEAELELASLQITGIREQIRNDVTGIMGDLRETLEFLSEYQAVFNSMPEPVRETIPDAESWYKLLDERLSASEYTLKMELQCAYIYAELLKITGIWE